MPVNNITPKNQYGRFWDGVLFFFLAFGVLLSICLVGAVIVKMYGLHGYVSIPIGIILLMVLLGLWVSILNDLDKLVRRHWLVDYIIDDSDSDVLKLYGTFDSANHRFVSARLLAKRPGYRLIVDPEVLKRMGCAMAAVPADGKYLAMQKELAEKGIKL